MPKETKHSNTAMEIPNTPSGFFFYVSKPYRKWAIIAALAVVCGSALEQGSAYIFKLIVDSVEQGDYHATLQYALFYPVLVLSIQLFFRVSGYAGARWATSSSSYTYEVLSNYALGHSHGYFTNRFSGSLLSKISNVAGAIDRLIPEVLWTHINASVSLIVTMSFLFLVDPVAGGIFVMLLIVLISYNRSLAKTKAAIAEASSQAGTDLRGSIVDTFSNVQAVRQYVQHSEEKRRTFDLIDRYRAANLKSWMYTEMMLFWNGMILFVFSLAMFWVLVHGWQAGEISTGDMVLVIALYAQITGLLIFIGRAFNATARTVGEMREGLSELLVPHEIVDTPDAEALAVSGAGISWQQVRFDFENQTIFKDFSLDIAPGQRLGLVGHSGAGKSTFVSLLLRQHEIGGGEISIDGQSIAKVTQDSLRQAIALVPQEPALFHRSIRDNILYGKPDASEAEVIEAAKRAQAHDFIMALPDGYNTLVGERGVKLSGGQKQRVAIARAMLKDAPILVLDEATSALDSESEVAIQKALETLMEGRTVIAIAHRLSTLRKMDRIIVLKAGVIVEDGTHVELSQAGGVYERLWKHQAGGFLKE